MDKKRVFQPEQRAERGQEGREATEGMFSGAIYCIWVAGALALPSSLEGEEVPAEEPTRHLIPAGEGCC